MLLTHTDNEARALVHLAEVEGMDPEAAAVQWIEATIAEVRAVVTLAHDFGLSRESEWAGDFISAHRYMRKHGLAAAFAEVAPLTVVKDR